jgi:hypothetical protein
MLINAVESQHFMKYYLKFHECVGKESKKIFKKTQIPRKLFLHNLYFKTFNFSLSFLRVIIFIFPSSKKIQIIFYSNCAQEEEKK